MKNKLKNLFILVICLPVMLLCSCGGEKPKCKQVNSTYYYNNEIACDIFNDSAQRKITIDSISGSKVNIDTIGAYAKMTFTGKSAELFHFYIEYIYFKVYTNEASEYELNLNINITNAIKEEDIKKDNVDDKTYSNTFSCQTKQNGVVQVKAKIDRVIATATGTTLTIDALTSDMFIDTETTFKWTIFDFKIYGEARAY